MKKIKWIAVLLCIITLIYKITDFVANGITVFDRFLAQPIIDKVDKAKVNYNYNEANLSLSSPLNEILNDLINQDQKYIKISENIDPKVSELQGFSKNTNLFNKTTRISVVEECEDVDCTELILVVSLVESKVSEQFQGLHTSSVKFSILKKYQDKPINCVLENVINGSGTSKELSLLNVKSKLINWLNRNYHE